MTKQVTPICHTVVLGETEEQQPPPSSARAVPISAVLRNPSRR